MSTTKGKKVQRPARRPEKKFGPFHNGLGIAIWLNEVQTDRGPRFFRSISVAPRRYRDLKTGEWKDAASYRPVDLPTLVLALGAAHDYIRATPLPGEPVEGDELEELHVTEDGEIVENPPIT
jgi:hypothetical protein